MSFFENLGKKVGEAAQAAARKSSEIVEVTKLNASINAEEDTIQKLYSEIGKKVFENFEQTGTADELVKEACEQLVSHRENIKNLKEKIAEVKGIKSCINCGTEMERTQLFCSKCGTRNEIPQPAAEESQPEANQPAGPVCSNCNAELAPGSAFCTNCGRKL